MLLATRTLILSNQKTRNLNVSMSTFGKAFGENKDIRDKGDKDIRI